MATIRQEAKKKARPSLPLRVMPIDPPEDLQHYRGVGRWQPWPYFECFSVFMIVIISTMNFCGCFTTRETFLKTWPVWLLAGAIGAGIAFKHIRSQSTAQRLKRVLASPYGPYVQRLARIWRKTTRRKDLTNEEQRTSKRIETALDKLWIDAHQFLGLIIDVKDDSALSEADELLAELARFDAAIKELGNQELRA